MAEEKEDIFIFVDIGKKRFAVRSSLVREVFPMLEPTPVPAWPGWALGLMDVRGDLIPLVDIAPMMGQVATAPTRHHLIVLLQAQGRDWGIIVERVEGVKSAKVRPRDAASPEQLLAMPKICLGITKDEQGTVLVVDVEALWQSLALDGDARTSR